MHIWLLSSKVILDRISAGCDNLDRLSSVPEAEGNEDEGASPWYIFNDFVVRNVPEQEALSFPGRWKVRLFYFRSYRTADKISLDSCNPAF